MTTRGSFFSLVVAGVLGSGCIGPAPVSGQEYMSDFLFEQPSATLHFNLGLGLPRAGSDLFDEITREYTLAKSDFRAPFIGGGVSFFLNEQMDLAFDLSYARSSTWSEYVDWVDADDLPIEQETTFTQVPLTVSLRYFIKERGRQIGSLSWIPTTWSPYIGAGGGTMFYRFEQAGDFIDFRDPDLPIFQDALVSDGWALVGQVFGGVQWSLSPQMVVTAEARYSLADAELERSDGGFSSYDPIDLSGLNASIGFGFRF